VPKRIPTVAPASRPSLGLGRRLLRLPPRLHRFLAIAPDHDDAEERADDGTAEQHQDDGDADRPDAGREEGLDGVGVVDEGLPKI